MESYNEFAPFYDRFIRPVDYPARARYFDALLKPMLGEGRLMLDLACGTGSLSVEMARRTEDAPRPASGRGAGFWIL